MWIRDRKDNSVGIRSIMNQKAKPSTIVQRRKECFGLVPIECTDGSKKGEASMACFLVREKRLFPQDVYWKRLEKR